MCTYPWREKTHFYYYSRLLTTPQTDSQIHSFLLHSFCPFQQWHISAHVPKYCCLHKWCSHSRNRGWRHTGPFEVLLYKTTLIQNLYCKCSVCSTTHKSIIMYSPLSAPSVSSWSSFHWQTLRCWGHVSPSVSQSLHQVWWKSQCGPHQRWRGRWVNAENRIPNDCHND